MNSGITSVMLLGSNLRESGTNCEKGKNLSKGLKFGTYLSIHTVDLKIHRNQAHQYKKCIRD